MLGGPGGVGRTERHTDGRTEFLPILQDFVPCWSRYPKKAKKKKKKKKKKRK